LISILIDFPLEGIEWLSQSILEIIPSDCLSKEEKETFCDGF